MEKKIYTKDLSIDEILERLKKGQKAYYKSENYYFEYKNGLLVYNQIGEFFINSCLETSMDYYFIDEVEEPEADESCIDKLCWFWCDNEYAKCVDILTEIKTEETYKYRTKSNVWKHCQVLTKEEALALVKE